MNATVHILESNNPDEIRTIFQEVANESMAEHFLLISNTITKDRFADIGGTIKVHVGSSFDAIKTILLGLTFEKDKKRLIFMMEGQEFSEKAGGSSGLC